MVRSDPKDRVSNHEADNDVAALVLRDGCFAASSG
jgi:hypothetical protein